MLKDFYSQVFNGVFKDKRLSRSISKIIAAMVDNCSSVINKCFEKMSEKKRAYRTLDHHACDVDSLTQELRTYCAKNMKNARHVLCIQDTSEFNFTSKQGRREKDDPDIGPLGKESCSNGFFLHPTLVVDAESFLPYGFADVIIWNRSYDKGSKRSRDYQSLPISQKESSRWYLSAQRSAGVQPCVHKTCVADREGDVYDSIVKIRQTGSDYLIRCVQDRQTEDGLRLSQVMDGTTFSHRFKLKIRGNASRQGRVAEMELGFGRTEIKRPSRSTSEEASQESYYVIVREVGEVPAGEEAIEWKLLTSHTVETEEQALQCVKWYQRRWLIEELFRVMKKKGMGLEDAQLETGERLKRLAVMCLHTTLTVMILKASYDGKYEALSAEYLFTDTEIKVLKIQQQQFDKEAVKAKKLQNPFKENSLAWASWIIARLGAWSGYESAHGKPGRITIRNGLVKLGHYVQFFQSMQGVNIDMGKD